MVKLYLQTVSYFLFLLSYWKVTRKCCQNINIIYPWLARRPLGRWGGVQTSEVPGWGWKGHEGRALHPLLCWQETMFGGDASQDWAVPLLHRPGPAVQVRSPDVITNAYYISSSGSSRRRRGWCQLRSQSPVSPPCLSLTKSPSQTDLPNIVTSSVNIAILFCVTIYVLFLRWGLYFSRPGMVIAVGPG